jgi:hypothetical protein
LHTFEKSINHPAAQNFYETDLEKENVRIQKELFQIKMKRDIINKTISIYSNCDWKIYQFISENDIKFNLDMMCRIKLFFNLRSILSVNISVER